MKPSVFRSFVAAAIACAGVPAAAQMSLGERLVASLSYCDARFFDEVAASAAELERHALVQPRGLAATFPVSDPSHPTESRTFFRLPVEVRGLIVIGYFDEVAPIPGGVALSWGFLVPATTAETRGRLAGLLWDAERLREETPAYVRSEVWHHDAPMRGWVKETTEPGPPKAGTVERVLLIEPYRGETVFIRLGCSLQGQVTRDMVASLRRDFPLPQK